MAWSAAMTCSCELSSALTLAATLACSDRTFDRCVRVSVATAPTSIDEPMAIPKMPASASAPNAVQRQDRCCNLCGIALRGDVMAMVPRLITSMTPSWKARYPPEDSLPYPRPALFGQPLWKNLWTGVGTNRVLVVESPVENLGHPTHQVRWASAVLS